MPGQERRSQEVIGLTEIWGALISLSLQQEFLILRYFYKRFQLSELQPSWLCPLPDRANNHPRAAWSSSWTSPGLCFHILNLQPTGRPGRGAGQPQGPAQAPSLAAGLSPHAEVTPREELGAPGTLTRHSPAVHTRRGITSLVTRKRSRWKSEMTSRKMEEVFWDRYVAKLWKS